MCIHTHTHIRTYFHTYTPLCMYSTCMYPTTTAPDPIGAPSRYVCVRVRVCVCVCVCMCTCVYACMYVFMYSRLVLPVNTSQVDIFIAKELYLLKVFRVVEARQQQRMSLEEEVKSSGSTLLRPKDDQRRETGTVLLYRPNASMPFVLARILQLEGQVECKQVRKTSRINMR